MVDWDDPKGFGRPGHGMGRRRERRLVQADGHSFDLIPVLEENDRRLIAGPDDSDTMWVSSDGGSTWQLIGVLGLEQEEGEGEIDSNVFVVTESLVLVAGTIGQSEIPPGAIWVGEWSR